MKNIILAFKTVFKDFHYLFLTASLALNLLAVYYFIFSRTTTFKVFFESNSAFYNWFSIISSVLISLLFSIALTFLIWLRQQKVLGNSVQAGDSLTPAFLGAVSTGCPVCGAYLASFLGIAGGLFSFPFQGLEIKTISLGLLTLAILFSAKTISQKILGICQPQTLKSLLPAFLGVFSLFLIVSLPAIADKFNFGFTFQRNQNLAANVSSISGNTKTDSSDILESINPLDGFAVNAVYGNLGPQLLAVGAIDFEKMKSLYEKGGQPLTEDQIKILTQRSNEKIRITPENSYFLLNFLWALGLANKNPILEKGPMTKYGEDQISRFASTGGWTLGAKEASELYSKSEIMPLNQEQQAILEEFAFNSYRPCCSNPTGFPDCNHGMAALALGEIMAVQGATVDEIFEAFKYFNAFWFPQTYFDIATYFKAKEGKNWRQASGRAIAGKDYSTPQGWQRVRQWLADNNLIEQAPSSGGGCGV